jgi:uncharacterized membrane protein YdfJ with MMPL/SSD domain
MRRPSPGDGARVVSLKRSPRWRTIAIDATIVRVVLVPATMVLLGNAN